MSSWIPNDFFNYTNVNGQLAVSGLVYVCTCIIILILLPLRAKIEAKLSISAERPWLRFIQLILFSLVLRGIWCFLTGTGLFGGASSKCLTGLSCGGAIFITTLNRISMFAYFAAFSIYTSQILRIGRSIHIASFFEMNIGKKMNTIEEIMNTTNTTNSSTARQDSCVRTVDIIYLLLSVWLLFAQFVILLVSLFTNLDTTTANEVYDSYIVQVAILQLFLVVGICIGTVIMNQTLRNIELYHTNEAEKFTKNSKMEDVTLDIHSSSTDDDLDTSSAFALSKIVQQVQRKAKNDLAGFVAASLRTITLSNGKKQIQQEEKETEIHFKNAGGTAKTILSQVLVPATPQDDRQFKEKLAKEIHTLLLSTDKKKALETKVIVSKKKNLKKNTVDMEVDDALNTPLLLQNNTESYIYTTSIPPGIESDNNTTAQSTFENKNEPFNEIINFDSETMDDINLVNNKEEDVMTTTNDDTIKINLHVSIASFLYYWRLELMFISLITSILFIIKSIMFLWRPVFGGKIIGLAGTIMYPAFFYTVPECLPAILVCLSISGFPLHTPCSWFFSKNRGCCFSSLKGKSIRIEKIHPSVLALLSSISTGTEVKTAHLLQKKIKKYFGQVHSPTSIGLNEATLNAGINDSDA